MPRLTNIDDVFFPVEERPVFFSFMEKDGEGRVPEQVKPGAHALCSLSEAVANKDSK